MVKTTKENFSREEFSTNFSEETFLGFFLDMIDGYDEMKLPLTSEFWEVLKYGISQGADLMVIPKDPAKVLLGIPKVFLHDYTMPAKSLLRAPLEVDTVIYSSNGSSSLNFTPIEFQLLQKIEVNETEIRLYINENASEWLRVIQENYNQVTHNVLKNLADQKTRHLYEYLLAGGLKGDSKSSIILTIDELKREFDLPKEYTPKLIRKEFIIPTVENLTKHYSAGLPPFDYLVFEEIKEDGHTLGYEISGDSTPADTFAFKEVFSDYGLSKLYKDGKELS